MALPDSGLIEFVSKEISKGPEQPIMVAQPEPKITAEINAVAERAASEIKKLQIETRETMLKNDFENPPAPVNSQGILDHNFLLAIKQLVVWKDQAKTIPDYERTKELRALAYEGYERRKSSKPVENGPVSIPDSEILNAIDSRLQRAQQPPEIRFNRHVHTS